MASTEATEEKKLVSVHTMEPIPRPLGSELVMIPPSTGSFGIEIVCGKDVASSSIKASGCVIDCPITDAEFKKLFPGCALDGPRVTSESPLYDWVQSTFGKRPNDVFAHKSTPWGDLYTTYGWPVVGAAVYVTGARVTGITATPTIIARKVYDNDGDSPITVTGGASTAVSTTTGTTYSQSNTIGVSEAVEVDFKVLGVGGSSTTTFSYSHQWGTDKSTTSSTTLGSTTGVQIPMAANTHKLVELSVSKGTMTCEVDYALAVMGNLALNYCPAYKGHHFWNFEASNVLQNAGKPQAYKYSSTIDVGFYTDDHLKVYDCDAEGNIIPLTTTDKSEIATEAKSAA